ncbi:MBL fold metallo-hydrolase [Sporosarcina sp. ACRSL]|uniref:MBL fold metallo-hydrolase n=1 Tax=Sporosarcina sp. ACRSL TaxID=2918215 RepID=UPI001EF6820C|nr:MBL fold metallo-hydrolase [Sporosarcina sp. ACRSL]MCG7345492.1 MBL fold metallo-hydrolase [Sporosarcina sp. ACRSL]
MRVECKSKHFELQRLEDGIYAAIAKDGGGAVGNAGFIDLGDQTIIFDTFNTQQAAADLKKCAEELTGHEVSWAINSHYHGDHIRGNQVFASCQILSSDTTYSNIKELQPTRIESQKDDMKGLAKYISTLETTLQETNDKKLEVQISFLKEIESSLPTLSLTLPTVTFQDMYTFKGSKRSAVLFTKGGGHTPCDAFLYMPDDQVIFMGDLLFVNTHPSIFEDSDVDNWINILQELLTWDINVAIPGHGPVGTKNDLLTIIRYMNNLKQTIAQGGDHDQIKIPEPYQGWALPELFQRNLKQLQQS